MLSAYDAFSQNPEASEAAISELMYELGVAVEADLRAGFPCVVTIPNHAIVADGLMVDGGVSYHINQHPSGDESRTGGTARSFHHAHEPARRNTVFWTSNLLSGFQTLETNTTGSFIDTVHQTDSPHTKR